MEPQLLVFDLDGTLIDSRADLAAAINHMRDRFGLGPLAIETVAGYIGDGVGKLVERSLQGAAVDFGEALRINKAYYLDHLAVHTVLYEGVAAGLAQLARRGHRLAVLTNKPGDATRSILDHFGLVPHFAAIIGGGGAERLKPAPDGLFRCMEAAGTGTGNSWMVGDHHTDLAAAKNAGIRSAFVHYGFGDAAGLQADAYFASFDELVGYFL